MIVDWKKPSCLITVTNNPIIGLTLCGHTVHHNVMYAYVYCYPALSHVTLACHTSNLTLPYHMRHVTLICHMSHVMLSCHTFNVTLPCHMTADLYPTCQEFIRLHETTKTSRLPSVT